MGGIYQQFFNDNLIARSWRMDPLSSFPRVIEFNETGKP
jgi:hypothetical protein